MLSEITCPLSVGFVNYVISILKYFCVRGTPSDFSDPPHAVPVCT
jgi:hypothetical protein